MGDSRNWVVPVAERQAAVVCCRDWQQRVCRRDECRLPRGWDVQREDDVRYDILRGGPGSRRLGHEAGADVPFVDTAADQEWAQWFARAVEDPVWARSLTLFDARLVLRRSMAGTCGVPLRSASIRRTERQSRNRTGRFVGGWEYGYHFRVVPGSAEWPVIPGGFAVRFWSRSFYGSAPRCQCGCGGLSWPDPRMRFDACALRRALAPGRCGVPFTPCFCRTSLLSLWTSCGAVICSGCHLRSWPGRDA